MSFDFLDSFRRGWSAIRQGKKLFISILLLDLAFFVIFALLHTFIVVQALPDLSSLNQLVAQEAGSVPQIPPDAEQVDPSQLEFQFPVEEFQQHFSAVVKYSIIYILAMFCFYNLVFAFTWRRASFLFKKASSKKFMSYWRYLRRFAVINLFWLILFVLVFSLLILGTTATMFGQITLVSQGVVDVLAAALSLVLLYFIMISHALLIDYPVLPLLKRTVVVGIKRSFFIVPVFIVIGVLYYLVSLLIGFSSQTSASLSFVLFILLFLPLVTGSRVFFMGVVRDADAVQHVKK